MATKSPSFNVDVGAAFEKAAAQFRGLNPKEPGQWPVLPKMAAWLACGLVVVAAGWVTLLSPATDELDAERGKEPQLRQTYRSRLAQAVNLGELRKQKLQVQEYVLQLEKQLPGKAEMDALLSDINQAGLGRGLMFELFRPGKVEIKDYYAELPIALRVTGRYHDVGSFAADVSNLSRIVTLQNLSISQVTTGRDVPAGNGQLSMEATARTYRYLDEAEQAQQSAAKAKQASGARK